MNIVLLGPPGAGKGTQANRIAAKKNLIHLSTGDVFRDAISHGTPLGLKIKSFVDQGKLIPDELVSEVVFEKISSLKSGFLLDGYPRTLDQVELLEIFCAANKMKIDFVLALDVHFDELIKRLSSRRQCPKCKDIYNLDQHPPKKENVCDKCGTTLLLRSDDEPAVVAHRLEVYTLQTKPVFDFYEKHASFRHINGDQPISVVEAEIERAFAKK